MLVQVNFMVAPVGSTVSLIIQIIVLALLTSAYMFKRRNKFRRHGITMLSAVILHIISILAVMIPSLASFFAVPEAVNYADTFTLLTFVHVSAGVIAALLGIWLVGSWHLKKDLTTCFRKKRFMDVTISLWLLAIFLGIVLYLRIAEVI